MTTPDLELRLQSLAGALDWPPARDLSADVAAAIAPVTRRRFQAPRRLAWAAALLLVVLTAGTLVVSPAARKAVASWLGVPGVEVRVQDPETTPLLPPFPEQFRLGEPVTLMQAQERVDFDIGRLDLDGPLHRHGGGVYLDDRVPGGIVHIVYSKQEGLPEVMPKGVGALFTQFAAARDDPFFTKEIADSADGVVTPTTVAGEFALWVQGPSHMLIPNRDGAPIRDEARLSANALLWTADGVTYRLESALPLPEAVTLAETLR